MFDSMRLSATAVNLLDWSSAVKLRPAELKSAGSVIERMRATGHFSDDKIRIVVKALFCLDQMSRHEAARHMELAFDVWDENHTGSLTVEELQRDLHIMHDELSDEQISQIVSGHDANGSGELDYDAFREIMTSLSAHHGDDEGKMKKLKRAAEDAAPAVRTVGGVQAAQMRRHELRLAGGVVRALGREGYSSVASAALLPAPQPVWEGPSTRLEDSAPSARLGPPGAQAALTHPRAPPGQRGRSPWLH